MQIKVKNNPFLTKSFKETWIKHFSKNKKIYNTEKEIKISLIKKTYSLFFNVGKNFTNGMSYHVTDENFIHNKSILIYDVPSYFEINNEHLSNTIGIKKIKQYEGSLVNIENFTSIDDFLSKKFKSKKRAELKKFKRKLENSFNIKYEFYSSKISKEEFNILFESFYSLLNKRYTSKKIINRNLSEKFKNYYFELIYKLINENKALLFVIKENNSPIAISISFLAKNIIFYSIPVFDIDFKKFNLGHISILKILEWSINQNFKIFDFSKGDAIYKNKWATDKYHYEHHLIYDKHNLSSRIIALVISSLFNFKQYLRDKKVNSLIQELKYKLSKKQLINETKFNIKKININIDKKNFEQINYENIKKYDVKKLINDFLYTQSAHVNEINLFKKGDQYIIKHKNDKYLIFKDE